MGTPDWRRDMNACVRRKMAGWVGSLVVAASLLLMAIPAGAFPSPPGVPNIDFTIPALQPSSASISFAGGLLNPLVGSGITISIVDGLATPLNPSPPSHDIISGTLDFVTGNFRGTNADRDEWLFDAGGSLTIRGAVPDAGISDPTTILLSGEFGFRGHPTPKVIAQDFNPDTGMFGVFKLVSAGFFEKVHPDLARFFGVSDGRFPNGGLDVGFEAPGAQPGDAFESTSVQSGDVRVWPPAVVPAPATLILLGLGLVWLGAAAWRRSQS